MSDVGRASRPIGPVHRAFGLLQLVVAAGEPVGVRDLARRSGLSSSTTGRMLGILDELGMVERTSDGGAIPGSGLAALTATLGQSQAVRRERLRPLAVDLMEHFGENAAVAVGDGDGVLYLTSARIQAAVQVADPAGERFDAHLVAPGLIVMAEWSTERLDEHLDAPLRAATARSVTDPERIRRRLGRIRRDEFAWTDQELDLDVNAVAAPIRSDDGQLVAAATLYGPTYRLNPTASPALGIELAGFAAGRSAAYLGE